MDDDEVVIADRQRFGGNSPLVRMKCRLRVAGGGECPFATEAYLDTDEEGAEIEFAFHLELDHPGAAITRTVNRPRRRYR